MKISRILFYGLLMVCLSSCHASYYKVKVTKPKRHFGYFNAAKDSKKKRVKTVRYKSLKKTKGIGNKD
ncbi:MAG: hypothetical protein JXR03_17365 [Cyclobacteriaceae bacterium]